MNHSDSLPVYIGVYNPKTFQLGFKGQNPGIVGPQPMHLKLRYRRTASVSFAEIKVFLLLF